MKLYANGCSFTWGGELFKSVHDVNIFPHPLMDENHNSPENLRRLEITWPKKLSDLLKCDEFHNHGMGCGSNDRIVRKTLEFFVSKINQGIDVSDYVVAIQWTESSRFEFFDDISKSWGIVKHDVFFTEIQRPIEAQEREDLFVNFKYNNNKFWASQLFANIVCLGSFLKHHNIKHVFTMVNCPYTLVGFDEYQLKYCNDNFTWYNNDITSSGVDNMTVERVGTGHPSELGHTQIAEHLYQFLSTQI